MPLYLNGTEGVSGINGTNSTPANRGSDTNTGIVYGTDTVQIATGGTTAVTVDSSQNVGIGVTPSAWGGTFKIIEVGRAGSSVVSNTANGNLNLVANAFYNGTNFIYSNNGYSVQTQTRSSDGTFQWQIAPSGTAGNAITFTQAMTLDSSGNLLVGTTTTTNYGNFSNNYKSATLSSGTTSSFNKSFSITNDSTPVSNTTVDALRFMDAAGNVIGNTAISGIVSIAIRGASSGNQYMASFIISATGAGTTSASITAIGTAQTRGTSPVTSVQLAADGAGGVKVTVTYINNTLVNSGLATATFTGVVSGA